MQKRIYGGKRWLSTALAEEHSTFFKQTENSPRKLCLLNLKLSEHNGAGRSLSAKQHSHRQAFAGCVVRIL
jgi:hypothetical protein